MLCLLGILCLGRATVRIAPHMQYTSKSTLNLNLCQVPIFPPLQSAADFDEAACVALVRAALGDPAARVSIAGVRTWTMSAQVAERFQVRESPFWQKPHVVELVQGAKQSFA